jgi:hypothetical protein
MTNGVPLMQADDGTGASATRRNRQYRMRRRPIGSQSHGIGKTAIAKRYRVASRAISSHAQPRWRNPYGESRLKIDWPVTSAFWDISSGIGVKQTPRGPYRQQPSLTLSGRSDSSDRGEKYPDRSFACGRRAALFKGGERHGNQIVEYQGAPGFILTMAR